MKPVLIYYRLFELFRAIDNGVIRVPSFQRRFLWDAANILDLVESVYNGFPIGVIIFFESRENIFDTAEPSVTNFPAVENLETRHNYPINYVIDGLQRLSSLYNCFHWKALEQPSKFNIIFDIEKEELLQYSSYSSPGKYIHLSSIFSSEMFIDSQIKLMNYNNSEKILNIASELHSRFQEYTIPVMKITGTDTKDVVTVFERLNSSGVSLTEAEILRARSELEKD